MFRFVPYKARDSNNKEYRSRSKSLTCILMPEEKKKQSLKQYPSSGNKGKI